MYVFRCDSSDFKDPTLRMMPCTNHRKVFQKTMHGINNSHDGNKSFPSSKIVIGKGWFVPSFNRNTVNQRRMIDHFGLHHVSTADDKQMSELTQAFELVRGGQLH